MKTLIIATRQSPLALAQAHFVKTQLERHPHLTVNLLPMTTDGDRFLSKPLYNLGGKGLFVKELEQALLDGRADLAVHSLKDMPAQLPSGLQLATYCEREDPRDVFVSRDYAQFHDLPQGARIGTSSLRRQAQLSALRPDLTFIPIRGNVGTRLEKLDHGECAGLILASAGLKRLGLVDQIQHYFALNDCLPAIGQGTLALECRHNDHSTHDLLAILNHPETAICARAERALNAHLNGGCRSPMAGYARLDGDRLILSALVGSPDGQIIIRAILEGSAGKPEDLGIDVAQMLLVRGAGQFLNE